MVFMRGNMRVYNKLVRDNIPDIIRKNGEIPCISILDDDSLSEFMSVKENGIWIEKIY